MNKSKLILLSITIIVVAGCIFFLNNFLNKKEQIRPATQKTLVGNSTDVERNSLPENTFLEREMSIKYFLEKRYKDGFFRSEYSDFVCADKILWKKRSVGGIEIVFAAVACFSVVNKEGVKHEESGFVGTKFLRLINMSASPEGQGWVVIDMDTRELPMDSPKEWVAKVQKELPQEMYTYAKKYTPDLLKSILK